MSMTNLRDFLGFVDSCPQFAECLRSVNLMALSNERNYYDRRRMTFVMDGEASLRLLYGRYSSDWCCGGQWGNMMKSLHALITTLRKHDVYLAIFFNGSLEPHRFKEWVKYQRQMRSHANKIFNHLYRRATPPPKVWWIPPCGLQSVLRIGLASLFNPALCSIDDHYLEIMEFCWKNKFHGIIGNHQDLAFFQPPRLFSARDTKLSLQFDLRTLEYNLDEVARAFDLNPTRFCLLGALLGNHILSQSDLSDFHSRLFPEFKHIKDKTAASDRVIKGVVNYIRTLPSIDDFEKIGRDVFLSSKDRPDERINKLKESVRYYRRGTKEGSLGFKNVHTKKKGESSLAIGIQFVSVEDMPSSNNEPVDGVIEDLHKFSLSPPTMDNLLANINDKSTNKDVVSALAAGAEVLPSEEGKYPTNKSSNINNSMEEDDTIETLNIPDEIKRTAADRHRLGSMSPYIYQVLNYGEIKLPVILENMKPNAEDFPQIHEFYRPIRQSVYAILFNLHHHRFTKKQTEQTIIEAEKNVQAMMKKAEKLGISKEEKLKLIEKAQKLQDQFKGHSSKEVPRVRIREWLPYNNYEKPVVVLGVEVPWAIPTIQRLWFGTSVEDKEKRIRAFMTCMRCEEVRPLLLQPQTIPGYLLFMACILRYIMVSSPFPILRKPELDAFLLSSLTIGSESEAELDMITPRGVQLSTLFMEGVEMALFANDACGAPLPPHMTLPWMFFNGKLFHSNLQKATTSNNIYELCDGNEDMVMSIETIKAAILPEYMSAVKYAGFSHKRPFGEWRQVLGAESVMNRWGTNYGQMNEFRNRKSVTKKKDLKSKTGGKNKKSDTKKAKSRWNNSQGNFEKQHFLNGDVTQ